jgi:hypothetical protein
MAYRSVLKTFGVKIFIRPSIVRSKFIGIKMEFREFYQNFKNKGHLPSFIGYKNKRLSFEIKDG